MSEGLPHPRPLAPLHPVTKPTFTGTGAGTYRSSRFGPANKPILPPKARPILLKGAVPVPVLSNGIGRYTSLLRRLTLVRCALPCGVALNRWIDNRLETFAKENPHVSIYIQDRGEFRLTKVYGHFSGGNVRPFDVHLLNEDEIDRIMHRLLYMNGKKEQRLLKYKHSVHQSVQGYWHPFLNKPWRQLTKTDTPNLKTEQELLQRRLIKPKIVETEV